MTALSAPSRRQWLLSALLSAIAVAALCYYLQWPRELSSRFLLPAAAAALTAPGAYLMAQKDRRLKRYGLTMGFCFALAQACGGRLSGVGTLALDGRVGLDFALLFACAAGFAPSVGGVFALLARGIGKRREATPIAEKRRLGDRAVFLGSAASLLLCWLPIYLAFYPGLFTYDVSYQYLQFTTGALNTHHPLLHTLMIGGFCRLGELLFGYPVKGVMLYTLFQMGLMALAMASAVTCLHRHGAPRWFCLLLLAMYALLPFNSLMAISTTKDTLFAGSILWMSALLLQLALEPERIRKPSWIAFFLLSEIAVSMMRNNGFACLLGVLIVALILIAGRRACAKRLAALCACGLLLGAAGNAGLKAAAGAESGPMREVFSVPIQQLSRVYVKTEDEAKPEILRWLPDAAQYKRSISDPVKDTSRLTPEGLADFLRLWVNVGLRHPVMYLDAFLDLDKEFYQLDGVLPGQYLETKFHSNPGDMLLPNSQWPALRDELARLFSRNEYLDIPILSALLSHAFWCWLLLWVIALALYLRSKAAILCGAASLMLFASVLFGPCVMLRYIYPLMIGGPFALGALLLPIGARGGRTAIQSKEEAR